MLAGRKYKWERIKLCRDKNYAKIADILSTEFVLV